MKSAVIEKRKGIPGGAPFLLALTPLYLALEPDRCIIRKAKIFRQKDRNSNGLSRAFRIVGGARFIPDAAGWKREER